MLAHRQRRWPNLKPTLDNVSCLQDESSCRPRYSWRQWWEGLRSFIYWISNPISCAFRFHGLWALSRSIKHAWLRLAIISCPSVNPSSPHDALKHHFTSLKTDLIFLQLVVLEWKFQWNWLTNTWQFSLIFHPHQIIFIHYKSRIAAAICDL